MSYRLLEWLHFSLPELQVQHPKKQIVEYYLDMKWNSLEGENDEPKKIRIASITSENMNKQIKINHAHASIMFHPKWPKRSATIGNLEQNTKQSFGPPVSSGFNLITRTDMFLQEQFAHCIPIEKWRLNPPSQTWGLKKRLKTNIGNWEKEKFSPREVWKNHDVENTFLL